MSSTKPSTKKLSRTDLTNAKIPGLFRRFGAIIYDSVLVFGLVFAAFTVLYLPLAMSFEVVDIRDSQFYKSFFFIYMLVVGIGFHLWFWTHGGQTLGMRTWNIKLFSKNGDTVTTKQALTRYLVAIISLLALGIGFFWSLLDKEKRTWHDIVSGTQLVSVTQC